MLQPEPEQRPSASQLLTHPWLAAVAPQTAIAPHIVHQLQLFAGLSRARRVMLGVAANSITGCEASMMLKHFLAFDKDFNGTLDYQELATATKEVRTVDGPALTGCLWGGDVGSLSVAPLRFFQTQLLLPAVWHPGGSGPWSCTHFVLWLWVPHVLHPACDPCPPAVTGGLTTTYNSAQVASHPLPSHHVCLSACCAGCARPQ